MSMSERGSLRDQLQAAGFKESPVGVVSRMYEEYSALVKRATMSVGSARRLEGRVLSMKASIEKLCDRRGIGNPFKGEPIEFRRRERTK